MTADSAGQGSVAGAGTGVVVTGGYFFKDTMFENSGSGGGIVGAGRLFPLPHGMGLWVGAGAFEAEGTIELEAADGRRHRAEFEQEVVFAELGLTTPWTPFPVGLVAYRHDTEMRSEVLGGPMPGRRFSGAAGDAGVGIAIHLLVEYFLSGRSERPRGLGVVFGYVGYLEPVGRRVGLEDGAGDRAVFPKWKPLRGESLRLGFEYEF